MSAVLLAMDSHPTNLKVQREACLAVGNIGRAGRSSLLQGVAFRVPSLALLLCNPADPSQCRVVLFSGGAESVSEAMEGFDSSPTVQIAAMAALSVVLANGWYCLMTPLHRILEFDPFSLLQFLTADHPFSQITALSWTTSRQQWSLSFTSLRCSSMPVLCLPCWLLKVWPLSGVLVPCSVVKGVLCGSVVSEEVESEVMQLMVEHTAIAMGTHSHDLHVTVWGCKLLAHAASNGESL